MNTAQRRALTRPALFGFETLNPRFGRRKLHHSEVLSVNAGWE